MGADEARLDTNGDTGRGLSALESMSSFIIDGLSGSVESGSS